MAKPIRTCPINSVLTSCPWHHNWQPSDYAACLAAWCFTWPCPHCKWDAIGAFWHSECHKYITAIDGWLHCVKIEVNSPNLCWKRTWDMVTLASFHTTMWARSGKTLPSSQACSLITLLSIMMSWAWCHGSVVGASSYGIWHYCVGVTLIHWHMCVNGFRRTLFMKSFAHMHNHSKSHMKLSQQ